MQSKHWTAFICLGAIWCASFLWIKIALDEIGPFTLVAFRGLFGVLFVGFIGVVVLLSKDLTSRADSSILGQAAVILASIFYAASSVYARRKTQSAPGLVRGAAPLVSATVIWQLVGCSSFQASW